MNRRPVIIALFVMLLMFCKAKTESVTTSTQSAPTPQSTATTAPPPATTTQPAATTSAASAAPAAGVIATQETNWPGITADVTEFRRKGNTLTARVRFTNKGDKKTAPNLHYNQVYLIDTAGGKKYEALKDERNSYIAALSSSYRDQWWEDIEPGASKTIWMKFPAPPPEVKTITLQIPNTPPFEDLTIQE